MRNTVLAVIFLTAVVGCARDPSAPISPPIAGLSQTAIAQESNDNHRLWGEWFLVIDSVNERVDVVPRREARFHLNAMKFLESYCTDCLKVTGIKNNGDSTIDLTVQITHPFKGHPEYTAFDVKGILIFDGAYEFPNSSVHLPLPNPFRISWRLMGDPEVLNPDGYTPRWAPNWDSGSELPIFKYWEGKYASGVPNADLNAYLDFYSHEERHAFLTDDQVTRTYKIWLPQGKPVIAGYAVEACWEPPTVMPVTNPFVDFPITANQPEAYYFRHVVYDGKTITDCDEWPPGEIDCSRVYIELAQWGSITTNHFMRLYFEGGGSGGGLDPCEPPVEGRYEASHMGPCLWGNGTHRGFCYIFRGELGYYYDFAYTVFDWTVNDPNY